MQAAVRFVQGVDDAATLAELRVWLVSCMQGEETATPAQFRQAMRDRYIRHAGYEIEADSSWSRACQLAERVKVFELRRWPDWERFSEVPRHADGVDALLWQARRLGDLPKSPRALFRLL